MCAVHLAGNVMLNSVYMYDDGKQYLIELKTKKKNEHGSYTNAI